MNPIKPWLQILRSSGISGRSLLSAYRALAKSRYFDREYYLRQNEDVRQSNINPVVHYLLYGAAEGRNPGPDFDTRWYRSSYPDAAASGQNPLFYFLQIGKELGHKASPPLEAMPEIQFDSDAAAHLRYYPDYTATNPYQNLLYRGVAKEISIRPGTIEDCIQLLGLTKKPVIYHQHWTSVIMSNSEDEAEVRKRVADFLAKMDHFIAKGGRVFWTIHNAISHEAKFPHIEAQLCADLAERAELIHVHSASVPELVSEYYELPAEKVALAPHGNYIGVYPDSISRAEARKQLGLPENATVFLFLGQIRRYKGIDQLLEAFESLAGDFPDAWLVVAGSAHAMDSADVVSALCRLPKTVVHQQYVPDDQLQVYFRAADFFVAPFTTVLTSGSILLSLSFGIPVIAPRLGLVSELIDHEESGLLYIGEDLCGLENQMRRAADLSVPIRKLMADCAYAAARTQDWSLANELLAGCLVESRPTQRSISQS